MVVHILLTVLSRFWLTYSPQAKNYLLADDDERSLLSMCFRRICERHSIRLSHVLFGLRWRLVRRV